MLAVQLKLDVTTWWAL